MCKFLTVLAFFFFAHLSFAQSGNEEISSLTKSAFRVVKVSQGNAVINAPGLKAGQRVLFVRLVPELEELETISQGIVKKTTDKLSLVEIDNDKVNKLPEPKDYAVLLGDPKVFEVPRVEPGREGFIIRKEEEEELEKGFVRLTMTTHQGSLKTTTTNRANSYKYLDNYAYQGTGFVWYPEFLPNFGIEYAQFSGKHPIIDYFSVLQDVSLNKTEFRFAYRNKINLNKIRWKVFSQMQTTDFSTLNGDEYILASQQKSIGLGAMVGYEFNSYLPMLSTPFYGQPLGVSLEISYSPNTVITDNGAVSRGESSSGSNQLSYSALYSHLFYMDWIPWFKRYFFEVKYTISETKINFQGATKNNPQNFYKVPENGEYSENDKILSLSFGLQFEDWLGQALKPRDK